MQVSNFDVHPLVKSVRSSVLEPLFCILNKKGLGWLGMCVVKISRRVNLGGGGAISGFLTRNFGM